MKEIHMIKVYYYSDEKLLDVDVHGTFKSFRDASEWLVNEQFEVYFDEDMSEMVECDSIGFIYNDGLENQAAVIETFYIED